MRRAIGRATRRATATGLTAALTVGVLALTTAPGQAVDEAPGAPASRTDDGWRVDDGPRGATATWTSAERLPITSARPEVSLRGEPLLPVTLAPDGYSLSVPAPRGTRPDDLDVTLSGRVLDAPAGERRTPAAERGLGAAEGPQ